MNINRLFKRSSPSASSSAAPMPASESTEQNFKTDSNPLALAMREVLKALREKRDPEKIIDIILLYACRLGQANHGSIVWVNYENEKLIITNFHGQGWTAEKQATTLSLREGLTGRAARTGQVILCRDTSLDPNYISLFENMKSELVVPIFFDDKVWGLISVDAQSENAFTEASVMSIMAMAEFAAFVIRLQEDLNQRAEIDKRERKESIERVVGLLSRSSADLKELSRSMNSSSSGTAEQATELSVAAEKVSRNAQSVAASVHEMELSNLEISKTTQHAAAVASNAAKSADKTSSTLSELDASTREIGKIGKFITSIAQQSRLLALNANIEAERAGEAGRSFAVVAKEVKELAKETATASEDIVNKINSVQKVAQETIATVESIRSIVHEIDLIQHSIAGSLMEQSSTTREISRNLDETVRASVTIAKSITVVAEAASVTNQNAKDCEGAAGRFLEMSSQLRLLTDEEEVL